MTLSAEAIKEFQEIYRQEFGEDISVGEAQRKGFKLLVLMRSIYRPIPIKEMEINKKNGKQ